MKTCRIECVSRTQWLSLLSRAQQRSFFQSPQCWELYSAMSFMEPFGIAVYQEGNLEGLIIGYIQKDGGKIKSYLSRRAIVNGGPLLSRDISEEALYELLKECLILLKGRAIYLETRNFEDYSAYKDVFHKAGFKYEPHLNFHIDTSSEEILKRNLSKSRKRNLNLSFREGVYVVDSPTADQLKVYYQILTDLYSQKVKTPLFPYEFFAFLLKQDYAKIFLTELSGKIIGGSVCVCLQGYAMYEWFECGQNGVYKNVYPSSVATYSAAQYASQNGFHHYDMMGAGTPDKEYGVRDFKASFGGKMVEYGRFIHIFNPVLFAIGKAGVKILKGSLFKKTAKKK